METTTLTTFEDCEDLVVGSTWLATGAGGSIGEGLTELKAAMEEGLLLGWVPMKSVPDDVWTATVGVHGTITAPSRETLEEISALGLSTGETNEWIAESVKELAEYLGYQIGCLVTCEIGPGAIADSLTAGARLGIPVVDGDYAGRAVPEELQMTYCLYDKFRMFFASSDPWGNVAIVKQAANPHMLERMAKMLSIASFGATAVASAPLPASEMKEIVVRNTLTKSLDAGRAIRHALETGRDPIDAALAVLDGWRLFEGKVTGFEIESRDGYGYGKTQIQGSGEHKGQKLDVWFKNENLVSWLNGKPWICSPDLLALVNRHDGRGLYNADIEQGDQLVAVGIRGLQGFRTKRGLELAGPRHFGFDIDYVPIEELVAGS